MAGGWKGCIEGVTAGRLGPIIVAWSQSMTGPRTPQRSMTTRAGHVPLFYGDQQGFLNVMRHAIALNGSFFNTQRMLQQYVVKAYFL